MRHILALGSSIGAALCATLGAWHAGQLMNDIRPGAKPRYRSGLDAWLRDDYTARGRRRRWWMLGCGVLGLALLMLALVLGV